MLDQISVFVENKTGRLASVMKILTDNNIDIRAMSVADTQDFGILRLIVSDSDRAIAVLKEAGCVVSVTQVLAVAIPDSPGSLAKVSRILADNHISIEYMYAFSEGDMANIVIRTNDLDRCIAILRECQCTLIETV